MAFSDPIVGGETLIRRAIKSANYIANVAGWQISRDGVAEFLNAVIRGTINIAGGIVNITNVGLEVVDSNSRYIVNTGAGFKGNPVPNDGSYTASQYQGYFMQPTDPYNGFDMLEGYLAVNATGSFFTNVELTSPSINARKRAHIKL